MNYLNAMVFLKGLRFGLLLQLAIGPVCLYILKTATESGIVAAVAAAIAATIVDATYVALAVIGIGVLLDKPKTTKLLNCLGIIVLIYFGVGIIVGSFGIAIIPGFSNLSSSVKTTSAFVKAFTLTASSPMTIMMWTGIFTTKVAGEGYRKVEMSLFGAGAVLMTLIFMGTVALLAGLLHQILTREIINVLNIAVGITLVVFAVRKIFLKTT